MSKNWLLVCKVFKFACKVALAALEIILTPVSDGRATRRDSSIKAHILYEDGLINEMEYMRSLRGDA